MINVKKIKQKVEERRRISLDSFLEMMDTLEELKRHGTKRTSGRYS